MARPSSVPEQREVTGNPTALPPPPKLPLCTLKCITLSRPFLPYGTGEPDRENG